MKTSKSAARSDTLREYAAKAVAFLVLGAIIYFQVGMVRFRLATLALAPERAIAGLVSDGSLALYAASVLLIYVLRRPARLRAKGILPRLVATLAPLVMPISLFFARPLPGVVRLYVGAVLCTLGHLLSIVVLAWLGRSFSVMPEARTLVTSGPYRLVRHPLYAAEAISIIGLLTLRFAPVSCAGFVVFCVLQWTRIRYEEQVLAKAFEEYRAYAARTPMLLPWP